MYRNGQAVGSCPGVRGTIITSAARRHQRPCRLTVVLRLEGPGPSRGPLMPYIPNPFPPFNRRLHRPLRCFLGGGGRRVAPLLRSRSERSTGVRGGLWLGDPPSQGYAGVMASLGASVRSRQPALCLLCSERPRRSFAGFCKGDPSLRTPPPSSPPPSQPPTPARAFARAGFRPLLQLSRNDRAAVLPAGGRGGHPARNPLSPPFPRLPLDPGPRLRARHGSPEPSRDHRVRPLPQSLRFPLTRISGSIRCSWKKPPALAVPTRLLPENGRPPRFVPAAAHRSPVDRKCLAPAEAILGLAEGAPGAGVSVSRAEPRGSPEVGSPRVPDGACRDARGLLSLPEPREESSVPRPLLGSPSPGDAVHHEKTTSRRRGS